MCGICGFISTNQTSEQQLKDMTDTLSHRGPDDSGVWMHEDNGYFIGFGHRRLSIFDLSELGHQPMESDDGSIVVTYNGEIYNFVDLRIELESNGYRFRSKCDTEVLIYAYKEWGDACIAKFNGMFAFALYDKLNRRAVFARDRIGKKPLYYFHHGRTLVFGSEMKALIKHPEFKKDINRSMISAYLANNYYHSPYTVFADTYKIEPGSMLVWENGTVSKQKYWDLLLKHSEIQTSLFANADEAKSGLKSILNESISQRLAADVPVGIFLSGGIDSAVVAGAASEVADNPVKSFTIGFDDALHNEADRAREIAKHLKTEHHELYFTENDILSLTDDIPYFYDEPFADSSQLPTMLVSRLAKQAVTVALTGDGGDELFCGYDKYDKMRWVRRLDGVAGMANALLNLPGVSSLHIERMLPSAARALIRNRSPHTKVQAFTDAYEEISSKLVKGISLPAKFSIEREINSLDWQEKSMLLDMLTYLPDDILCKADRASMRYALELRCPLLDYNVIEYSFQVPMKFKYCNGDRKWLLKQIAYDYVPQSLLDMPKRGFGVPIAKWLRGPLSSTVRKFTNKDALKKQDIFSYEAVMWLVDMVNQPKIRKGTYSSVLWAFIVFQMWYQLYIEDLW